MSKKTFGIVAACICWALFLSGFLSPRWSMIEALPGTIVALLAYAFFTFEKPSNDAGAMMFGILIIFFGGAYFRLQENAEDKRFMRALYQQCEEYKMGYNEGDPFYRPCYDAREWYLNRYVRPYIDD